jgi:FAD-dependent urate hydroxylase
VTPLPRPIFIEYANWFARKSRIEFTPEKIIKVKRKEGNYEVTTETGDQYSAKNIVVATGVEDYKYLPGFLKGFSQKMVSH